MIDLASLFSLLLSSFHWKQKGSGLEPKRKRMGLWGDEESMAMEEGVSQGGA